MVRRKFLAAMAALLAVPSGFVWVRRPGHRFLGQCCSVDPPILTVDDGLIHFPWKSMTTGLTEIHSIPAAWLRHE